MLGLAIVAMAALATVGATSALATTPEWLNNGAAIVAPIAVKTSGTLLLADLNKKWNFNAPERAKTPSVRAKKA